MVRTAVSNATDQVTATVTDPASNFGPTGSVTLTCASTQVQVPVTAVWTPLNVTFQVPPGLSGCSGGWVIHYVTATSDCTAPLPESLGPPNVNVVPLADWLREIITRAPKPPFDLGPTLPCDDLSLEQLVGDAFTLTSVTGTIGVLEPGEIAYLEIVRTGANELTDVLDLPASAGYRLDFGVQVGRVDGAGAFAPAHANEVESVPHPIPGQPAGLLSNGNYQPVAPGTLISLRILPEVVSAESPAGTGDTTWVVRALARVTVPSCQPTSRTLTPAMQLSITQAALRVPTVALFFEDPVYSGNCLLMVPSNTTLGISGFLDQQNAPAAASSARDTICRLLDVLRASCALLGWFAGKSLPTGPVPIPTQAALNTLATICARARSNGRPVVDATGAIGNLDDRVIVVGPSVLGIRLWWGWRTWNELASSVALVCAASSRTYECYHDTDFRAVEYSSDRRGGVAISTSGEIRFSLPPGAIVGTLPALGDPRVSEVQAPFASAPLGPSTANPEQIVAQPTSNDRIRSIRIAP